MFVGISHFYESLIEPISFKYKWNSLLYFASVSQTTKSRQHKSICRRKLFRVNGLCAFDLHAQSVVKKKEKVKREESFVLHWHGPWSRVKALEQISRENLKSAVSTILNCYPPITLSTDAQSNRQLARCIFSLIFHISLWHDIIPDDCLSVMVYDEKCSGLLMWDVSVYHFDGWPPW